MRRKKTAVPATVLNGEPVTPTEGVIDLDAPETKTEYQVPEHVGETVVLSERQHAVEAVGTSAPAQARPKRKYTRKAVKSEPSDYQQRVIAELEDLNNKRVKLSAFLNSLPSAAEVARLTKQLETMTQYADILKERIDNFGKING